MKRNESRSILKIEEAHQKAKGLGKNLALPPVSLQGRFTLPGPLSPNSVALSAVANSALYLLSLGSLFFCLS